MTNPYQQNKISLLSFPCVYIFVKYVAGRLLFPLPFAGVVRNQFVEDSVERFI